MAALGSNASLLDVDLTGNLIGKQETLKVFDMRGTGSWREVVEICRRSSSAFETVLRYSENMWYNAIVLSFSVVRV